MFTTWAYCHTTLHLLYIGPMVDGEEIFDDHCIFANKMLIDRSQVRHLRDMVDDYPEEPIKYYVYKLCSSCVKKTGKMVRRIQLTNLFHKKSVNSILTVNNMLTLTTL